jgi:hypothetical protein
LNEIANSTYERLGASTYDCEKNGKISLSSD